MRRDEISYTIFFSLAVAGIFFLGVNKFQAHGTGNSQPGNVPRKIGEIPCPEGYKRVKYPQGSYIDFLRNLPVKITDKIKDYKGERFSPVFPIFGVVDLPFLFPGQNLEQRIGL